MTDFAKYNAKDLTGFNTPRMSGKEDYIDEVKAIWFEFGRTAGIREGDARAEARIIKLLEDTKPENGFAMFTPEWVIALIRGKAE